MFGWHIWRMVGLTAGLAVAGGMSSADGAQDWPQFRGPSGQGYTQSRNLPLTWGGPARENVLWQAPLVAEGHASPIVWGDRVFVCGVRWPPGTIDRAGVMPEHHVACYAAADGKLLWNTLVPPGPWLRNDFRSGAGGGYAAPTPCTDGHLVFCAFGSSVVAALDFQGHLVWRKEIVPYTHDVTYASSPELYGNTAILFCPSNKAGDSRLTAYRKADGEVKWEVKFPDMGFGHSTPLLIRVNGRYQMLLLASGMENAPNALRSVDPETGKLIWWCRGAGDVPTPAFADGLVYFDSGRGGPAVVVDTAGTGDLSDHVRWRLSSVPEGLGSPIIVGKYVYRLHSSKYLRCCDMGTGKEAYSERLGGISSVWASPIADQAGRIYFATAGKSFVIQSGPQLKVLAVNDLGDPNDASPAVSGDRMYLVGLKSLYCVGASAR